MEAERRLLGAPPALFGRRASGAPDLSEQQFEPLACLRRKLCDARPRCLRHLNLAHDNDADHAEPNMRCAFHAIDAGLVESDRYLLVEADIDRLIAVGAKPVDGDGVVALVDGDEDDRVTRRYSDEIRFIDEPLASRLMRISMRTSPATAGLLSSSMVAKANKLLGNIEISCLERETDSGDEG